jgi:hypothetical protein
MGCRVAGRLKAARYERLKATLHVGGRYPYGVDPSFNSHSSLYRADSFQRRWQFFNSSANSPELSTTGAPFAFFPRRSHGFTDGFPVFFPVCVQPFSVSCVSPLMHACTCARGIQDLLHTALFVQVQASAAAVRRMHQVLRDAAFLDDRSDVLQARFITYNHPHETFCTVEMQFVQGRNGAFYGKVLLLRHGWAVSTKVVSLT